MGWKEDQDKKIEEFDRKTLSVTWIIFISMITSILVSVALAKIL